MAASLTASKNPVYLTAGSSSKTTIRWNTDGNFDARVVRVIDLSVPVGGSDIFATITAGGPNTGQRDQDVSFVLGTTYTYTLRRNTPDTLLATLVVTASDLADALVASAIGSFELRRQLDPPQRIRALRVEPSIDTVRVRFQTIHPTIPVVEVQTMGGQFVGRVIPLLNGLQSRHDVIIGQSDPLPQGTVLRLRIKVPGQPSARTGKPGIDVIRTAEFKTGARTIWVTFDRLQVRADGDDGNKGDFRFGFIAGDAGQGRFFGAGSYKEDIPATDPRDNHWRSLNLSTTVGFVKHEVNVIVQGLDDDRHFFSGVGYPALIGERDYDVEPGPPFIGSFTRSNESADWTEVGDAIPIRNLEPGGATAIPFRLNTGDFKVAFTVEGHVRALMRVGQGVREITQNMALIVPSAFGVAATPGSSGRARGKRHGSGAKMALAADGSVWLKHYRPETPDRVQWQWAAPSPGGPVTLILDAEDRTVLLALNTDGEAVVWSAAGAERAWVRLGQQLTGALVAIEGRKGRLELFGVDPAGAVRHRSLASGRHAPGKWRTVGGHGLSALVALPAGTGTALFALDGEGQIVHGHDEGDSEVSWRRIGGPAAEWFGVVRLTDEPGGVVISALTEDRVLHLAHWRNFPSSRLRLAWRAVGAIDEIVSMRPIENSVAPVDPGDCGRPAGRA